MVRLLRVPHTVICGVHFLKSYGGGNHSSFSKLSALVTVCPLSRVRRSASPPERRNTTWSQSPPRSNRAWKARTSPTPDSGGMSCSTTMIRTIPLDRASSTGMSTTPTGCAAPPTLLRMSNSSCLSVDCQSLSVPRSCSIALSMGPINFSWAPGSHKISPGTTLNPTHLAPEK